MEDLQILKDNSTDVFIPDEYSEEGLKRALIFIPDLSLNGAQTVMIELLDILRKFYSVTIISSEDGEYREKYLNLGVRISVRPYVSASEDFKEYMRGYDLVLLNTSSTIPYLYFFINTQVKTLIWLHESKDQLQNAGCQLPPPQLLSPNITICGVTKKVKQGIKELFDFDTELLHMPIREENLPSEKSDNKVRFFIPAAYTYIKGQDILLGAIAKLPPDLRAKSEFIFCGYTLEGQKEYHEKIVKMGEMLDNVTVLGSLDRSEVYKYYSECDCVAAPSRIDSTPTSIIEGMMFKKLVLVSSGAGISQYLTDCVNGFVYSDENGLFQRLLLLISDCGKLSAVADKGYEIYKDNFSPDAVEKNLLRIISE